MADKPDKKDDRSYLDALASDVELIWKTLEFNRETIRPLERPPTTQMRPSTDSCSAGTVCTSCSSGGCVMTVYH